MTAATRLELRVVPGARRPGVVGRHGDAWKLRVSAPPEGGRANDAVVRLLAGVLGLARSDIAVVSGHTARDKVVELQGIARHDADRLLGDAAGDRAKALA